MESNDASDFLTSLTELCRIGALGPGGILVLDNAKVHTSADIELDLNKIKDRHGFSIATLPTYSPELNPCELVFAKMKRFLRTPEAEQLTCFYTSDDRPTFQSIIMEAISHLTKDALSRIYEHCSVIHPASDMLQAMVSRGLAKLPEAV